MIRGSNLYFRERAHFISFTTSNHIPSDCLLYSNIPQQARTGWLTLSVRDLLERLPPERAARMRRLLGPSLTQLWVEALRLLRTGGAPGDGGSFLEHLPLPPVGAAGGAGAANGGAIRGNAGSVAAWKIHCSASLCATAP